MHVEAEPLFCCQLLVLVLLWFSSWFVLVLKSRSWQWRGGGRWLIEVRVIPENPVSILSRDVTGCEWVDSACIRFNK